MKKTKLVLLTVLIILVLYCGLIIFVTKPSTFAYDALFKGVDSTVTVPSSEKAAAQAAAEREDLIAEMEAIASEYADKAVAQAAKNADAAIMEAIGKIDTGIGSVDVNALVNVAVRNAMASAREEMIQEATSRVLSTISAGKDAVTQEVVDKVTAELLSHEDEVVERVADEVIARITSGLESAVEEALASMSDEDYEKIRKQIREEEINRILNQLHD